MADDASASPSTSGLTGTNAPDASSTAVVDPKAKILADVQNRFTYHPPKGDQPARYNQLRDRGRELAELIVLLTPVSREQSLALTKLEERGDRAERVATRRNEQRATDVPGTRSPAREDDGPRTHPLRFTRFTLPTRISPMARTTGTVKWFNDDKGYGFITPDGATSRDEDCFVHYSNINAPTRDRKTLAEGALVSFDITPGAKGPQAIDVTVED